MMTRDMLIAVFVVYLLGIMTGVSLMILVRLRK